MFDMEVENTLTLSNHQNLPWNSKLSIETTNKTIEVLLKNYNKNNKKYLKCIV
jgi:hypothetical protein